MTRFSTRTFLMAAALTGLATSAFAQAAAPTPWELKPDMTTAARFSAGPASEAEARVKAATSSAIFRRVASSNGLTIPLDYNTSATDEMTLRT